MYYLTAHWIIKPGCEAAAKAALKKLARDVKKHEPNTLLYLIHTPDMSQQSFPPASPQEVNFMEGYKNKQHFLDHINGPIFKTFMAKHACLFALFSPSDTRPFMQVEYIHREGGFVRPEAS
jgi:uncharacterized protein